TLYARTDPLPQDEAGLTQAVEQCLLRLEQRRLTDLFDYKRAEMAEAEANNDEPAADRLREEIRLLQHERATLDRQLDRATLLGRARHERERTATPAGGTA
ncbi:MAG TPA: hypothetical protein VK992_05590, partial [Candidatus Caenarcaniphilales bacterium]|nr:hypothetical protein [Candidatus Caenarcaniphilales bacterium]